MKLIPRDPNKHWHCIDQEGLTTVFLRGQVTFVFPGGLAAIKFQSHANPDIP